MVSSDFHDDGSKQRAGSASFKQYKCGTENPGIRNARC